MTQQQKKELLDGEASTFEEIQKWKPSVSDRSLVDPHFGTPIPRPERMDDPLRSVRYRVLSDGSYEPSNADARLLLERLRDAESEAAKLRGLLDRAAWIAEHLMQMIDRETWRATGGDDGQGHYEGDCREASTFEEIQKWKDAACGSDD